MKTTIKIFFGIIVFCFFNQLQLFANYNLTCLSNPAVSGLELTAFSGEDIASAIRSANAPALAKYFNSSIDLSLPGNEITCSKAQAEQIVRDFFAKNPPKSFKINHQGASKDGSQFFIGTYVSAKGKSSG